MFKVLSTARPVLAQLFTACWLARRNATKVIFRLQRWT